MWVEGVCSVGAVHSTHERWLKLRSPGACLGARQHCTCLKVPGGRRGPAPKWRPLTTRLRVSARSLQCLGAWPWASPQHPSQAWQPASLPTRAPRSGGAGGEGAGDLVTASQSGSCMFCFLEACTPQPESSPCSRRLEKSPLAARKTHRAKNKSIKSNKSHFKVERSWDQ